MLSSSLVGHTKEVSNLLQLHERDKLPHALLFSGDDGIGKKLCAYILMSKILCGNCSATKNDLNECGLCKRILDQSHPDVSLIAPEGKSGIIKVQLIRNVRKFIFTKPLEGRYKFLVIDDAHAMSVDSQNALLKILEEPPERTFIILISSQPQELLLTVKSRCHRYGFKPLSHSDQVTLIQKIYESSSQDAKSIALFSQGSMSRAKDYLQIGKDGLSHEAILGILKSVLMKDELVGSLSWPSDRRQVGVVLDATLHLLRDVMVLKNGGGRVLTCFDEKDQKKILAIGSKAPFELLESWVESTLEAKEQILANIHIKLVMNNWIESLKESQTV